MFLKTLQLFPLDSAILFCFLIQDKGQMETDLILRSRNQIEPPVVGPILTSHGSTSSLRTSPQVAPKAPKHSSKSKLIRIPHSPSIKRKNKGIPPPPPPPPLPSTPSQFGWFGLGLSVMVSCKCMFVFFKSYFPLPFL